MDVECHGDAGPTPTQIVSTPWAHIPDIVTLMLHDQQEDASGGRQQQIGQHGLVIQSHGQTSFEQIHIQPAGLDVSAERAICIVHVVMEMSRRR